MGARRVSTRSAARTSSRSSGMSSSCSSTVLFLIAFDLEIICKSLLLKLCQPAPWRIA